jgi:succinate dehydrogenase hydrophobic anchor subunit
MFILYAAAPLLSKASNASMLRYQVNTSPADLKALRTTSLISLLVGVVIGVWISSKDYIIRMDWESNITLLQTIGICSFDCWMIAIFLYMKYEAYRLANPVVNDSEASIISS